MQNIVTLHNVSESIKLKILSDIIIEYYTNYWYPIRYMWDNLIKIVNINCN